MSSPHVSTSSRCMLHDFTHFNPIETNPCSSRWYKRAEAQKRYSFFFSSTTLAGGFGGLLASAIGKMDGMRGYRGWRWIFIIGECFSIQTVRAEWLIEL